MYYSVNEWKINKFIHSIFPKKSILIIFLMLYLSILNNVIFHKHNNKIKGKLTKRKYNILRGLLEFEQILGKGPREKSKKGHKKMKSKQSRNEKKNEEQDDLLKDKEDDLLKDKEDDLLKNKHVLLKSIEDDLLKSVEEMLLRNKEYKLLQNEYDNMLQDKDHNMLQNKDHNMFQNKDHNMLQDKNDNVLQDKNDNVLQNEYHKLLQNKQDDNSLKGNPLIVTKQVHNRCMNKTHENRQDGEKNDDILLISPTKVDNIWKRLKKSLSRGMFMNFLLNDNNNNNNNEKKHSMLYFINMLKKQFNYYSSKNSNDEKFEKSRNEGEEKYDNLNKKYNMVYNWKIGQECFMKKLGNVHNFEMNGVNYYDFNLLSIPTIGYSKSSKRLQLMYKTDVIYGENENEENNIKNKLFLKKVPANLWIEQYKLMKEYDGEYLYGGENYVMEFLVFSFLDTYHPDICPKLYKILYEPPNKEDIKDAKIKFDNIDDFVKYMEDTIEHNKRNDGKNNVDNNIHNNNINDCIISSDKKNDNNSNNNNNNNSNSCDSNHNNNSNSCDSNHNNNSNSCDSNCGYVVMVSEYYGEDIFDFIIKRRKNVFLKIRRKDKINILHASLKLLARLHDAGLSHLDLTPDNILISKNMDLRLCDFAKSTPMYSNKLRHLKASKNWYKFESYETNVAKSAYTPPECWEIFWRYYELNVKEPLEYLKLITNQEERKKFYFDVASADKFMLGVLFIWIWTSGNLWGCSDPLQDDYFFSLMKSEMNFNNFPCTQNWPHGLKHIIKQLLHMKYRKDLDLNILSIHPWWYKRKK